VADGFEQSMVVPLNRGDSDNLSLRVGPPSEAVRLGCDELHRVQQLFQSVAWTVELDEETRSLSDVQLVAFRQRASALQHLSAVPSCSLGDSVAKTKALLCRNDFLDPDDVEVAQLAINLLTEFSRHF